MKSILSRTDPQVAELIELESIRQKDKLSMIPSENFFSPSVREAVGSVLMHKYSEGNIDKRYYEGNEYIDRIETLAIKRARELFKLPNDWGVNVQALAGSNANIAVYLALLKPGSTMMSMFLPDGGHLSHGWSYEPSSKEGVKDRVYLGGKRKVNLSSKLFNVVQYKTDPKTKVFDYDELGKIAKKYNPDILITGGTAYPRDIDYIKMRSIADSVGALYMADIAHEAGLVAAGALSSPVGIADVVTMTTHKTLRSGRGAIILARQELIDKINRGVLPGLQGGPFNNNIAGICVGLGEALKPEFKTYAKQVIVNAKALSDALLEKGFNIVSGGTDKHLVLIDLTNEAIYGKYSARALDIAGIVSNMNTMPGETRTPIDPSALRLGTPLLTTRGMKEDVMVKIASWIREVVDEAKKYAELDFTKFQDKIRSSEVIESIRNEVKELCSKYPLNF